MKRFLPRIASLLAGVLCVAGSACESDSPIKKKPRPVMPGEEVSDLPWNRTTGPNDVTSPMGIPTTR